ncbi:peptide ABC transporter substrate-binding protein [Actinokineospora bangkokensis]|uniref:Peptide ABC transporter substrate-binding protein n=1 Tax=Actinokineospora bangkokensis TaxID=1193682 RepID=A0A1Q9LE56_9PSEU|nr:peptide ABC transporter substrate-binding protein [Actinokineospora bangkokensis]
MVAVVGGLLAGCTNAPPPPLVTSEVVRTQPSSKPDTGEAVVGVDSVQGGYNPHKLADQSTVTTALAQAVLPSVFRPGPDGALRLDRTLMTSAEVSSAEPYTVVYRVRPEAAWSDSAPIAAEDFVYLWQQLREAPGSIDGAGYRLISNISARDSGREVTVTFAKPYPGWRSLFANLLPAHLLKDIPGGWANALAENYPVAGGPFSVRSLDRDRGEVVLERNDRYWATPAPLDRVVLRRGDLGTVTGALRTGHDQLALLRLDAEGLATVRALEPDVTTTQVPRAAVATVLLRPVGTAMADQRVRAAVAALLDRRALVAAGTGGGPSATALADAQVLAPSAPGYRATLPAGQFAAVDAARSAQLLTEAGYAKGPDGVWAFGGAPLELVIAAPQGREDYLDTARELQRQLAAGGVKATLLTPDAEQLYGELLAQEPATGGTAPGQRVDVVVAPQPAGGDPASLPDTRFGCGTASGDGSVPAVVNPAAFCDPGLQQTLDGALTGATPLGDALAVLEPALWSRLVAIPLYQEVDTLVVRREMTGVSAGPPFAGPFAGSPGWQRAGG